MSEKFTFFWGGPFSQWYPCRFVIQGIEYNCAEQFMMAEKARLFGDTKTLQDIMTSHRPREQKALGRQVYGFDPIKWEQNAKLIVYRGNYAKFKSTTDLLTTLLDTSRTTLVEASPYDKIWGIGLDEHDSRALNRETWLGTNLLGEILTTLREDII